jgi:hypothetical protein
MFCSNINKCPLINLRYDFFIAYPIFNVWNIIPVEIDLRIGGITYGVDLII